jgi:hypothetical protein
MNPLPSPAADRLGTASWLWRGIALATAMGLALLATLLFWARPSYDKSLVGALLRGRPSLGPTGQAPHRRFTPADPAIPLPSNLLFPPGDQP